MWIIVFLREMVYAVEIMMSNFGTIYFDIE